MIVDIRETLHRIPRTLKVASLPGGQAEFTTIADALAQAQAGDVILIYPGTYAESALAMVANIRLVGTNCDQCIIEADDPANEIIYSSVDCSIENLTVRNLNAGAPSLIVDGGNCFVRNSIIGGIGCGDGNALEMMGGELRIYDSTIGDPDAMVGNTNLAVSGCTLCAYGCYFYDSIDTAGALGHWVELHNCCMFADISSLATGATTLFLYNCYVGNVVVNAGTGIFEIHESKIFEVACTNAGGTIDIYGGYIDICTNSTGQVLWFADNTTLKVITGMKIAQALANAAAGFTILLGHGTWAENLTMKGDVQIIGESPDSSIISKDDAANPIIASDVSTSISNVFIANQNPAQPAVRVTANGTLNLRNCTINWGTGGGIAIQMAGGTLRLYDCQVAYGTIDLSTAICTLSIFRSRINGDITTAGAFAHALIIEATDFNAANLTSGATGQTTLSMQACTQVGTVSNLGTGVFTIANSNLTGVTVNNASAVIQLANCHYRVITRTAGNIVDISPYLQDIIFHVMKKIWEALTAAVYFSRTGGAGTVTLGGAGQVRLRITNAAADVAATESAADAAGSLESSYTPARTPRYIQQVSVSAFGAGANGNRQFYGLRATLGAAIPAAAEQHAGFLWNGTNFMASSSDGVAQTTNLATPSTNIQHQLEVIVFAGVKVEFYVDGTLVATHSTRIPSALLDWQELIHGAGTGAASAGDVTLRRGGVQECPA